MAGRRGARAVRADREKGVSTVEVVALTPLFVMFALFTVGLALYAQNVSRVQSAASDAARIASQQLDPGAASSYANLAASNDMDGTCDRDEGGDPVVSFPPKGAATNGFGVAVTLLKVTVTCDLDELGVHLTIAESAYAPVDTFGGGAP